MTHAAPPRGRPDPTSAIVRYQIADIDRAIGFYTGALGFALDQRSGDVFAIVSRGDLRLLLSGPGSSGSRPMADGATQQPGGWNRIVLYVDDLAAQMDRLGAAGVRFRNQIERGPGGSQILLDDPDGNPIELHEAPAEAGPGASGGPGGSTGPRTGSRGRSP